MKGILCGSAALLACSSLFAAEPPPRIAHPIGELRQPDGTTFQVMSAWGDDGPSLADAGKILASLAAQPSFALFARTFPRLPVQIVPFPPTPRYRDFFIRASTSVGPYEVMLEFFSVSLNPDLTAAPDAHFFPRLSAYLVPPDAKNPTRDEIGPVLRLSNDSSLTASEAEIQSLCRDPAGYLRAHLPSGERGQRGVVGGLSMTYDVRIDVQLQGGGPPALKITPPAYPFEMSRAGLTGEVAIEFSVQPDGSVADLTITNATEPDFGEAVRDAARTWKFMP